MQEAAKAGNGPVPVVKFPGSDRPLIEVLTDICRPRPATSTIFPGYLAYVIRRALDAAEEKEGGNRIIAAGSVRTDTIGDGIYAVRASDFQGAEYAIHVECVKYGDGWVPSHLRPGNQPWDKIQKLRRTLEAIQTAAEGLAALNPENNLTAKLIASLAKEARGQ